MPAERERGECDRSPEWSTTVTVDGVDEFSASADSCSDAGDEPTDAIVDASRPLPDDVSASALVDSTR